MTNEEKELELLRQYFYNDKDDCKGKNKELKERILKIQKQNKLKRKIDSLKHSIGLFCSDKTDKLDEILKELGYKE